MNERFEELKSLIPYVEKYMELSRYLWKDQGNHLLSIPAAASLLGVSRETIDLWLLDPELPRVFVGTSKQVRLQQSDLLNYLNDKAKHWYTEAPRDEWGDY